MSEYKTYVVTYEILDPRPEARYRKQTVRARTEKEARAKNRDDLEERKLKGEFEDYCIIAVKEYKTPKTKVVSKKP